MTEKPLTDDDLVRIKEGKQDPDAPIKEIGSANPIADYRKMADERKEDRVAEANTQMEKMIKRFIDASMNNNDLYEKAL